MTRDEASVPGALVALADRWRRAGGPAQSAIPWPRLAWEPVMPTHANLLAGLPDRIGREHVRSMAACAADDDERAINAFVASMVWGFGRVGYGPWRTRRILDENPGVASQLRRSAEIQAQAGAVESYRYLANEGRIRFLGPAFATKYLHFVPQAITGPPALILDAVVSRAIATMTGAALRPTIWRTATYARYLDLVVGWSDALGADPPTIEMLLFVSQAPGQWTEPWLRDP
jgi:hypothetical protein